MGTDGKPGKTGGAFGLAGTFVAPAFVVGTLVTMTARLAVFVFPAILSRSARRRSSSRFVMAAALASGAAGGASGGVCARKTKLVISRRRSLVFMIVYRLRLLVYRLVLAAGRWAVLVGWRAPLVYRPVRDVFQLVSQFYPLVLSLRRLRSWAWPSD